MNIWILLFGLAALLAIADNLFGSSDKEPEPEDPPEDEEPTTIIGTDGDDLIETKGGQIVEALGGDDTIISVGEDTIFAGPGDDIILALGAATMFGGEGADIFAIQPETLDANDAKWPVIGDFNPDEDVLVLDFLATDLGGKGTADDPLVLTGVPAPDGEGLMVQANGFNLVQLSTYGGGDMQAALEALDNDFGAFGVIGANITFPGVPPDLPAGVEFRVAPPSDGAFFEEGRFVVSDDFEGGGEITGRFTGFPVLDLSEFSGNASIIETDEGKLFLQIDETDLEPTLLTGINKVILGPGENTVSVGSVPGGMYVIATDGVNDISAWRGTLTTALLGGTNTVYLADEGTLNLRIIGGDNTITADEFVGMRVTMLEGADGTTVVAGGNIGDELRFLGSEPELLAVVTESAGLNATWAGGSLEMERVGNIWLQYGATLDATALDPDLSLGEIFVPGPNATVIGGDAPLYVAGQGQFLGGAGDDVFEILIASDGGALVDGGGGQNTFLVYFSAAFAGDVVVTGGEGPNSFFVEAGLFKPSEAASVLRITDFADDDQMRLDLFGVDLSFGPLNSQLAIIEDPDANQVEIRVNDLTLVIFENRASLPDDALSVFDITDR